VGDGGLRSIVFIDTHFRSHKIISYAPHLTSTIPIPTSQFPHLNSHISIPTSQFPHLNSHISIPTSQFPPPPSFFPHPTPYTPSHPHLITPKQRHRIRINIHIRRIPHNTRSPPTNHTRAPHRIQIIDIDIRARVFDTEDLGLAVLPIARVGAGCFSSVRRIEKNGERRKGERGEEGKGIRTNVVVREETI
jgi:hypothetical protein